MCAALWHVFPGPWWARLPLVHLLATLVLAAQVTSMFPWVSEIVAPTDVTVDA